MELTLESLVGEHVLTGVDESTENVKREWSDRHEDCQCINFVLDGVTYCAVENPDDGYRSSMDYIKQSDHAVKNTFPPVRVLCKMTGRGDYHENDTLEMVCIDNGQTILEVGTDNADDYYPSFVAAFWPERMPVNA